MQINWPAIKDGYGPLSTILSAIVSKAKYWLWILLVWVVEEILKHRLFSWINGQIDKLSAMLGPHMMIAVSSAATSLTSWTAAHPFELFMSFVGLYCVAVVSHACYSVAHRIEANDPSPPAPPGPSVDRSATMAPLDDLEIPSDDGLGIRVWFSNQPATGTVGLLISVINDGTESLKSRKVRLARARSFDSKRKNFIDDLQAHVLLPAFGDVPHNNESKAEWLVLINHDKGQLEIGGKRGGVPLRWPPREPIQTKQVWLLTVAVEAERVALHAFHFLMEWTRPNTIKVRKP